MRYRSLQKYIKTKLNEMKLVETEINNKLEKENNDYEKIGLNSILHLLINNIKDDFKDEMLESEDNTNTINNINNNTNNTDTINNTDTTINKNNDKILVVISCHTDNSLRLNNGKGTEKLLYKKGEALTSTNLVLLGFLLGKPFSLLVIIVIE
jgi:hypothetical protein